MTRPPALADCALIKPSLSTSAWSLSGASLREAATVLSMSPQMTLRNASICSRFSGLKFSLVNGSTAALYLPCRMGVNSTPYLSRRALEENALRRQAAESQQAEGIQKDLIRRGLKVVIPVVGVGDISDDRFAALLEILDGFPQFLERAVAGTVVARAAGSRGDTAPKCVLSWAASRRAVVAARNWRAGLPRPRRRASARALSSTGRSVICVFRLNTNTDLSAILCPRGPEQGRATISNTPSTARPPMANNVHLMIVHPICSNFFIEPSFCSQAKAGTGLLPHYCRHVHPLLLNQLNILDNKAADTRFDQCLQGFRIIKKAPTMSCTISAVCAKLLQ